MRAHKVRIKKDNGISVLYKITKLHYAWKLAHFKAVNIPFHGDAISIPSQWAGHTHSEKHSDSVSELAFKSGVYQFVDKL